MLGIYPMSITCMAFSLHINLDHAFVSSVLLRLFIAPYDTQAVMPVSMTKVPYLYIGSSIPPFSQSSAHLHSLFYLLNSVHNFINNNTFFLHENKHSLHNEVHHYCCRYSHGRRCQRPSHIVRTIYKQCNPSCTEIYMRHCEHIINMSIARTEPSSVLVPLRMPTFVPGTLSPPTSSSDAMLPALVNQETATTTWPV